MWQIWERVDCVCSGLCHLLMKSHTRQLQTTWREREKETEKENGWIRQLSTLSDYYAKLNDLFIFIYRLQSERFKFNAKLRNGTGHTITDSDNADPKTIYDCGASKSKSRAHLLHVSICRMVAKIFHVPFQMMAAHDHQAISIIKSNGYFSTRNTFSTCSEPLRLHRECRIETEKPEAVGWGVRSKWRFRNGGPIIIHDWIDWDLLYNNIDRIDRLVCLARRWRNSQNFGKCQLINSNDPTKEVKKKDDDDDDDEWDQFSMMYDMAMCVASADDDDEISSSTIDRTRN